jgi:hypothetical protein
LGDFGKHLLESDKLIIFKLIQLYKLTNPRVLL